MPKLVNDKILPILYQERQYLCQKEQFGLYIFDYVVMKVPDVP